MRQQEAELAPADAAAGTGGIIEAEPEAEELEPESATPTRTAAGGGEAQDKGQAALASVLRERGAIVACRLGSNFIACEESSEGERHLLEALKILRPKPLVYLSVLQDGLNSLGVLWSGRDDHEQAKRKLVECKLLFETYGAKAQDTERHACEGPCFQPAACEGLCVSPHPLPPPAANTHERRLPRLAMSCWVALLPPLTE